MQRFEELFIRYPELRSCGDEINAAYELLANCFRQGGKLLIAGNGGSAADAEHIAGELMKKFMISRPVDAAFAEKLKAVDPVRGAELSENLERSLPAIPLVDHESVITAYMNDANAKGVFAQQLLGYGKENDVFLAISTSGKSENILCAAVTAKALNLKVLSLTGAGESPLQQLSDVCIRVPETETYKIQEMHLPVYHSLCMVLEKEFFG